MDESLLQFALKTFVTLIVVVDPLGVAPIFVALTSKFNATERNQTLRRALIIAFGVTLFFLLCGRWMLAYLGVTVHAFAISGGILLFAASWPMLFGHRPGTASSRTQRTGRGRTRHCDVPVGDPVAFRSAYHHDDPVAHQSSRHRSSSRTAIIAPIVAVVYLIAWCVLYAAERIMASLGEGKMRIITRVLGIVLAALAVQFVLNGIGGFYDSLIRRPV
jgi:multiple antibiotic resistance protein